MQALINIIQIVVGILLILVVIIQQKGAGLGSAFGGDFSLYRTKRGAEKLLFYITIGLSVVFIILAFVGLVV
ncbi:preprotein translocase subunit SecG [Candidatus Daviesbacteria bacterium]|nr:preprotein translocase subunit SecG [Candidatus Daviesbacteria bacterium]